jgi:hypothetical protein
MKVKCQKIINEQTQQEQSASPWLTVGKEYIVLMIEVYSNKNYFLMIDDSSNEAPHLQDAKQFEVISHHIPSNWQINAGDLEITTLGPSTWQEPSFWERCHDGDESALEIYKFEARIIIDEENAL